MPATNPLGMRSLALSAQCRYLRPDPLHVFQPFDHAPICAPVLVPVLQEIVVEGAEELAPEQGRKSARGQKAGRHARDPGAGSGIGPTAPDYAFPAGLSPASWRSPKVFMSMVSGETSWFSN